MKNFVCDRPDKVVLVGEVLIHGGRAEPAGRGDFSHRDAIDSILIEQGSGGFENAAPLALAMSVVGVGQFWFFRRHARKSQIQPIISNSKVYDEFIWNMSSRQEVGYNRAGSIFAPEPRARRLAL